MRETVKYKVLLDRDTLSSLQQRQDAHSLIHLALHLGAFLLIILLVIVVADLPLLAFCFTVLLAAVWATLFAPFHECTHQTAFKTRHFNTVGAWLSGIPFGMAPAFYRAIHFQHHRYTHDPTRDPELLGASQLRTWPTDPVSWLSMISGLWLLRLKVIGLFNLSRRTLKPAESIAPSASNDQSAQILRETRLVATVWLMLVVIALLGVRGAGWLLLALILSHLFQATWLTAEHTGLPNKGTIFGRTRSMQVPSFIRWWLWNMNFHAEHHAWPAVPWDKLPELHNRVANHLEHQARGYWRLQVDVLQQRNLPDGTSMPEPGQQKRE